MAESPGLPISELLRHLEAESRRSGIPLREFLMLLCDIIGESRTGLYFRRDECLNHAQMDLLNQYLERLQRHEPVQYILGRAFFYGREFTVSPAVLIPRPETEGLVELVLSQAKAGMKILDIGTGSGVIAITLKASVPSLMVDATDISAEAIAIARRNADNHDCSVRFFEADLFPPLPQQYDLIVSNPPYIAPDEYLTLPPQVRDHEPVIALLAEGDGLDYYRRILSHSPRSGSAACSATRYFFEIGYRQAESMVNLAYDAGFERVEIKKDLNGLDRFAMIY